jgi:hypothetical protein
MQEHQESISRSGGGTGETASRCHIGAMSMTSDTLDFHVHFANRLIALMQKVVALSNRLVALLHERIALSHCNVPLTPPVIALRDRCFVPTDKFIAFPQGIVALAEQLVTLADGIVSLAQQFVTLADGLITLPQKGIALRCRDARLGPDSFKLEQDFSAGIDKAETSEPTHGASRITRHHMALSNCADHAKR